MLPLRTTGPQHCAVLGERDGRLSERLIFVLDGIGAWNMCILIFKLYLRLMNFFKLLYRFLRFKTSRFITLECYVIIMKKMKICLIPAKCFISSIEESISA